MQNIQYIKYYIIIFFILGDSQHSVNITMSIFKSDDEKKSLVSIDKSPECIENTSKIYPRQFGAIKAGVEIALTYGPKLFYPVI